MTTGLQVDAVIKEHVYILSKLSVVNSDLPTGQ